MLVSFHESYTILIQLCTLFCVLVLVYNFLNFATRDVRDKFQEKRIKGMTDILTKFEHLDSKDRNRVRKWLNKTLVKSNGLLALAASLDNLGIKGDVKLDYKVNEIINKTLSDIYIKTYKKLDDSVHSLIISLMTRCNTATDEIKDVIVSNFESKSLLLRIQTLRYISSQGDTELMIGAIEKINKHALVFNNKLLTDTFIEFSGNRDELLEKIWVNHKRYSIDIMVSMIQMLTQLKYESFDCRLYEVMNDDSEDKELRIAAIKYFGAVVRPEFVYRLAVFLTGSMWEYGAVAANTLRNYDCSGIFNQLVDGCRSGNWYVRNNCAKTLVACCTRIQIQHALRMDDRYARESIIYVIRSYERGRKIV